MEARYARVGVPVPYPVPGSNCERQTFNVAEVRESSCGDSRFPRCQIGSQRYCASPATRTWASGPLFLPPLADASGKGGVPFLGPATPSAIAVKF